MPGIRITDQAARRFILGRQGLWPGRRWRGRAGVVEAINAAETIQMDPLAVVARSHDLALHSRVLDYRPEDLETVMYEERRFFDYGTILRIYPMGELPYWRLPMRRRRDEAARNGWLKKNRDLVREIRGVLRARGPLGNRHIAGRSALDSYRGRKDSAFALYVLWLSGEVMVHHRERFERVYGLFDSIAPAEVRRAAGAAAAERFFARKVMAWRGLCPPRTWAAVQAKFIRRPVPPDEARRVLERMERAGEIAAVSLEGERDPHYLPAADLPLLTTVASGGVPEAWRPLETTTEDEVVFLAPLEVVTAGGRARRLFGFDYVWEVYKPEHLRKWGYYVLPVLWEDRLVARCDLRMDRAAGALRVLGFWLEEAATGRNSRFADALGRGFLRLGRCLKADRYDIRAVRPANLRQRLRGALPL